MVREIQLGRIRTSADLKWVHVFSIDPVCLAPGSNLSFSRADSKNKSMIINAYSEWSSSIPILNIIRWIWIGVRSAFFFLMYMQYVQVKFSALVDKTGWLVFFLLVSSIYWKPLKQFSYGVKILHGSMCTELSFIWNKWLQFCVL